MPTSAWSTTAADNGATLGIDIAENCDAANVNNALREMMAQLKTKLDAIDALIAAGTLDGMLTALAALTTSANQMLYFTGADAPALTTLSAFARTLLDDGDGGTMLATLGLSVTTAGSGHSINIPIGGTTYRLQLAQGSDSSAEGSQTVTWPVEFGTSCLFATVGTRISSAADTSDAAWQLVGAAGTANATVYRQKMGDGPITTSSRPTLIGFGY